MRYARDADLGVRNHPRILADVVTWSVFTVESAAVAHDLITRYAMPTTADAHHASVAARMLSLPVTR